MLLSDVWEKYHLDKKIESYSLQTIKTYCFQFKLLLRYFGNIDINEMKIDKRCIFYMQSFKSRLFLNRLFKNIEQSSTKS